MKTLLGPHATRLALLLGGLLALPFLGAGLFADDYYHQLLLEQGPGAPGSQWGLFTFATGDWAYLEPHIRSGPFPWWALEELRFIFVRPLSVALHIADKELFGRAFALHHLHSIGWYLALIAVVAALFRRALGATAALAALATLLFAIDDAHSLVAGWIANRNALVATCFALLGLLAHVRWREDGWRPGLPLSLLGCALGLLGGESALGAIAYFLAYELVAAPGGWKARARALTPLALLGVAYIALYRWRGAGSYGSGIYMDPVREPLVYLAGAPAKALALVGAQFLGATSDLWLAMPKVRPALVVTGVVALGLVVPLWRRLVPRLSEHEQRGLRWLTLGGVLSVIPILATFPLNRLLLMPSIGGSAVVAMTLLLGWRATDTLSRVGARLFFFTAVVMGVTSWPINFLAVRHVATNLRDTAEPTALPDAPLAGRVYVFVAPDPMSAMYTPQVRGWLGKPPRAWLTFSFARYPHRLTRVDARTFELEVVGGRLMETVFEELMRDARFPLPVGFKRQLDGVSVEVVGLDAGLPNRLRLVFDEDPEQGDHTFVQWRDAQLAPLTLPRVGESLDFPLLKSAIDL